MNRMRSSNFKTYLFPFILLILLSFMGGSCFDEKPKEDKSGDIFVFWLFSYLSDPPHKSCSYNIAAFLAKSKTLEPGAIIKSGDASYINDYYIINASARQSVNIKIELKSNCQVSRSFEFCLNNRYGYASFFPDSKSTVCSDNSIDFKIPIQGDVGTSETCQLSYAAETYYINVYNYLTTKDCYYEISYNY